MQCFMLRGVRLSLAVCLLLSIGFVESFAQTDSTDTYKGLKELSLEELMDIQVTSVSRRPEKLMEAASAIQVITGTDIRTFGATSIPEALYLAGNLQVARKGSHQWGVTARGFNTDLANKLLVMIDGRTIYTPLFSGVFWERQDYLPEDINRIEVISGPGGTLWGANAVNGVINITTKGADETQGLFAEAGGGTQLQALAGARYGGRLAPRAYYRVYGRYRAADDAVYRDGRAVKDAWSFVQGGVRVDSRPGEHTSFTVHGDFYYNPSDEMTGGTSKVTGSNILGRWSHDLSDASKMILRAYVDQTNLKLPTAPFVINGTELAPEGTFEDGLITVDVDFQHSISLGTLNKFDWGLGYRFTHDDVSNSPSLGFFPTQLDQNLFSGFVQDEITLTRNLALTLGTKLEHNDYTGFEIEPGSRLSWQLNERHMVWAAMSRAVRTPSRVDRDLSQGTPPYFVLLTGNSEFRSETVIAREAGYRGRIAESVPLAVSFFYNTYDRVRSTVLTPTVFFPLYFKNGLQGETYGFESTIGWRPAPWWDLLASYMLLREDIGVKDGEMDFNNARNETADPKWQFMVRSTIELPYHLSLNPSFRWVDRLAINDAGMPKEVPSYAELDARLEWQATERINVSLAGRNLLHRHHMEYGIPGPGQVEIERSVLASLVVRI